MVTHYGFRIVGDCRQERRLIDWQTAFIAYCECDDRADVNGESYISAFTFDAAFRRHLESTGSTKDYCGNCCAPWLWFDVNREGDLECATRDVRRLVASIADRYAVDGDDLLAFFSGSKGFHVGLPTSLWQPKPSNSFHRIARRFAENLADQIGVSIDSGVYDKVRAFRAPNSRHQKTKRHKRRVEYNELLLVSSDGIAERAREPRPFEIPDSPAFHRQAVDDWNVATRQVAEESKASKQRRVNGSATLNRATLEFIRDGATNGDRHRLLFSAAANLAEFGCSFDLAFSLLSESALDSGLPPKEVRRQIECGLNHRG